LLRAPDQPSANALLRDQPPDIQQQAITINQRDPQTDLDGCYEQPRCSSTTMNPPLHALGNDGFVADLAMPRRLSPHRQPRLYIAEWRVKRGLSRQRLADRLGTTNMTVSRWERGSVLVNTDVMAALADVLSIEPEDLFRHPDQPSADALLRDAAPEVRDQAIAVIEALRRLSQRRLADRLGTDEQDNSG
jgi:DNA-binding transcriptional regulator YiaG